jgi:hypothetical protein
LSPLESALGNLKPAPAALDRDRLMFRAGQAAAGRNWAWPASTAVLFATSLVLAGMLVVRPAGTETVRVVYVPAERPAPAPPGPRAPTPPSTPTPPTVQSVALPPASAPYLALREQVVRFGVDSLPDLPPLTTASPAPTVDRLFDPPQKSGPKS